MNKPRMTETQLKAQLKDYLAIHRIFSWPVTAGIASYKGAPDRILHLGNGKIAYLEVKLPNGKQSEHQKAFDNQCAVDGVPYWLIHSVEELEQKLKGIEVRLTK